MTRAVGLDLGSVRIGVAICDPGRVIASPYEVIRRGASHDADHAAIERIIGEERASIIVVGLPLSMSGRDSTATKTVRAEVTELRATVSARVVVWDERLSSVSANRALIEGGVRRRNRKDVVDKVAAAVILQSWIDAGCPED